MNSNKKLMGLVTPLFVFVALSVALFGLSSVAWGANVDVTTTFEDTDDEAVLAFLSLGGPYSYVDLSDATVVENGQPLVIGIAASGDWADTETITLTLPTADLEWDTPTGVGGVDWFTEGGETWAGATPTLVKTDAQTLTFLANSVNNAAGAATITLDVLKVRAVSTTTSAVATGQVTLGGTATIDGAGNDCGNIVVVVGSSVSFDDPVANDDTTTANGYSGLSDIVIADYEAWADGIAKYDLWVSTDSALVDVSEGERLMDDSDLLITDIGEVGNDHPETISTKGLQEGTYYIYASCNQTGTRKVGRSDGLVVTHRPYAFYVSPATDDTTLDSGGLYRPDGTADGTGVDNADIFFTVVDYDDNAAVRLYYGPAGLDESHVITSGSAGDTTLAVDSLRTATLVAYSDTLCENEDTFINWNICITPPTVYVAADNYYMYAVSCDGKHYNVRRSEEEFYVKHSPSITLDALDEPTPNTNTERYVTISWGQTGVDGDKDIDNGATISLYYSDDHIVGQGWDVGDAAALIADLGVGTWLITSGIAENPDGRTDNQYVWDLWTYTGTLPTDGTPYYIYAIISDGESAPTQYLGGGVAADHVFTFDHDGWARLKNPVDAGSTVNEGESYRFNWEDVELDASLNVKIILIKDGALDYDVVIAATPIPVDYQDLDIAVTGHLATSTANTFASGNGPTEDDEDDYYDFKPEGLTGVAGPVGTGAVVFGDGIYHVFICLSTTAVGVEPANTDLIFEAPGTLTVSGTGGTPVAYGLEMTPTDVVAAAGDTVKFSIYANENSQTVTTAYVYVSADTTYWTVVDQAATSGTQPFDLNTTDYTGSELENDTHGDDVSNGLHHLDFTYYEAAFAADGTDVLATFQLVCRGVSGANEADTDVNFDQVSGRETAFYEGMDQKLCSVPTPAATAKVMRRGTIAGRVPLQGRESDYSKEITFSLRKSGSFEPITDAAYVDSNDTNLNVDGVQITTIVNGSFELIEVPSGVYTLVVHTDGYLDGQLQDISVDPGDHLSGQDPTYDATPTDQGKLLGGDCAGYTDTTGATDPDNQVDTADENAVNNVFDTYVTDSSDTNYVKDIDGDGHIYTSDLNMVTGNTGTDGVAPVYKPVPGDNAGATFSVVTLGHVEVGEVFDVVVRSENIADVRAYAVRVQYDGLRLMGVTEGSFLRNAAPAAFVIRDRGREVVIASAIRGRTHTARADDEVAVLRFESRKSGAPVVRLSEAEVFDSGDRRTIMRFAAQVPERFTVSKAFPNPFNPTVTLSIQLVEETEVSMNIFDVLGRKVATVESGWMNPGAHVLSWDGRNSAGHSVASGLYFFAVDAGSVREVRKAALLR